MALLNTIKETIKSTLGQDTRIPDHICTDIQVPLLARDLESIEKTVQAFYELRNLGDYQDFVLKQHPELENRPAKNLSILMSFDFHITPSGPKLIEVNTNAAFGLVVDLMNKSSQGQMEFPDFEISLKADIENEFRLFFGSAKKPNILIVDENLKDQAGYFEMQLYQKLFEAWGLKAKVCDLKEIYFGNHKLSDPSGSQFEFVYNRHTDFLLQNESSGELAKAYKSGAVCFSPNPFEYCLLAHKQRLIDLTQVGFLDGFSISQEAKDTLAQVIPKSFDVSKNESDRLWEDRKSLFFKPKSMFGSKGVYRGNSISRTKFESLLENLSEESMMAQEYFPPSEFEGFKYDVRAYVYNGKVRLLAARLYNGQVTNLRTPGGGLALMCKS